LASVTGNVWPIYLLYLELPKRALFHVFVSSNEQLVKRTAKRDTNKIIICRKLGNVKQGVEFWKVFIVFFKRYQQYFGITLSLSLSLSLSILYNL
jgi:hypothetical protein